MKLVLILIIVNLLITTPKTQIKHLDDVVGGRVKGIFVFPACGSESKDCTGIQ